MCTNGDPANRLTVLGAVNVLRKDATPLAKPYRGDLDVVQVSNDVGNVRNNCLELLVTI
ncbi:MAG: hypothetical protein ABJP02_00300 [Parasphingorhabdus sp.]|uniref:hypothetical protein n=1 Tax=Parasphingorhabdus sp. TaxID=2709688 RepID=UPI003297FB16